MLVGSRVVRGPDWNVEEEGDQEGGEGFVGTITSLEKFQDGSALPKETVFVCWDTGFQSCYRAGQDGYYDLRILDSASAGVKFSAYLCSGCSQSGIAGMRWKCEECPDYNLCTLCYMKDEHDRNHIFFRFDSCGSSKGVYVGRRTSSTKIQSKGIFPGASVKTGKDWTLEPLSSGTVLRLDTLDGIPRSAALVDWENFCEISHRLGHNGKVELELVQFSFGPCYYKEHLPRVSLNDAITIEKPSPYLSEMQVQRKSEITTLQSKLSADQKELKQKVTHQRELRQKLTQQLQKNQQIDNITTGKHKQAPPPIPPKPKSQVRDNKSIIGSVKTQEARQYQTSTEPLPTVKAIVKALSPPAIAGSNASVKPTGLPPPVPTEKRFPALMPSKKSRPAPPPPRPHSTIPSGFEKLSAAGFGIKKGYDIPPFRGYVTSLAANLDSLLRFSDPPDIKDRMQPKRPPEREMICTTCDNKASKVAFEPCGHIVHVVCQGCAWNLKRCLTCNELIDKKTTPDGQPLVKRDNEMDRTKELEKQLAEVKRELECPICMDRRSNILFNCGHLTCLDCSNLIAVNNNQCPICKECIVERKRIYN